MVLIVPQRGDNMPFQEPVAMRRRFVLDKRTNKLLEELASYRGGNRSLAVREAIQVYSDREDRLSKIEADPGFPQIRFPPTASVPTSLTARS
jgi:hypothetical protein